MSDPTLRDYGDQVLFPDPLPSTSYITVRATDPDTSRHAAADNGPKAPRHRDLALRTLRAHPEGLTDFELAELTGIAQTSVGKRRLELLRDGLVEQTDKRRPSPSGSAAIVWRAT